MGQGLSSLSRSTERGGAGGEIPLASAMGIMLQGGLPTVLLHEYPFCIPLPG